MIVLLLSVFGLTDAPAQSVAGETLAVPSEYGTIQAVIDAAISGDKIEVAPGTYHEAINFNGKTIWLCGTGGAEVTTIDGGGAVYHVVQCINGEESGTRLEGFTITGGNAKGAASDNGGGGMYNSASSPTVINCIFAENEAAVYGGGMYNNNSSPDVNNCAFSANSAGAGGGMGNSSSSPTVTNCTFTDNTAKVGGGMNNHYGTPTVTNCILWADMPNEIYNEGSSPIVAFCDVEGGWTGTRNIDLDPLFEDTEGRLSWNSPCIDAGDNSVVYVLTDLDGNPRFADFPGRDDTGSGTPPIVDMGAYEWADADADGIVDSIDFARDVYSNDFFAWLPFKGTIADRADQTVLVAPAAPGLLGVKIKASGGNTPARVDFLYSWGWTVCSVMLGDGDEVGVSSGSIDIAVVQGTVEMVFVADDGTEAETSLNADNSIDFEPETCAITAPETNVEDIVVVVDGGEIVLGPGESKLVAHVDVDPDTLNLKSEGTGVTCYIELPAGFDVGEIDVSTVMLNGQVPAELAPTEVGDYDGDGIADLMVKFDRAATNATLEVAEVVQISVGGQLNDGTEFEDTDVVRVIEPGSK